MSTRDAPGNAEAGSAAPVPERPMPRGLLDWLFVRAEIARARETAARFSVQQREFLRRARLAFELGELALSPGNAVRSGSAAPLAANLFRQSLYWALLSQSRERETVAPEVLWAAADSAVIASMGVHDAELAQISTAMGSTFVELAEGSPETQLATAQLLRGAANRLMATAQRPLWRLEWAKLKRLARVSFLCVMGLGLLAFGLAGLLNKPDLAKGKHWRLSSVALECHPENSECGGTATDIFFHTKNESNPWFEYDFGAPLAFSSLTIRNRSDCCAERAVPLIVEVSDDDTTFREVARNTMPFSTWAPSFPIQHARYLRLRVGRESILHLEAISVHP